MSLFATPVPIFTGHPLAERASASWGRRGCERIALVRNMLDINGDRIACRKRLSQGFVEKLVNVPPSALRLPIRLVATRHGLQDSSGPSRDAFPARSRGDQSIWPLSAHPATWRSPRSLPAAARCGLPGVAQAVEPANPISPSHLSRNTTGVSRRNSLTAFEQTILRCFSSACGALRGRNWKPMPPVA